MNKSVNKLKSKNTPATVKPVLEDEAALSALNDLHSRFVVVPIDKASNNVAIICKRFYIQKLLTEVGIQEILRQPTKCQIGVKKMSLLITCYYVKSLIFHLMIVWKLSPLCIGFPKCITTHLDADSSLLPALVAQNHWVK